MKEVEGILTADQFSKFKAHCTKEKKDKTET
jgi:hypothetical protein